MSKKIKSIITYSLIGLVVLSVLLYKFLPADVILNVAGKDNKVYPLSRQ